MIEDLKKLVHLQEIDQELHRLMAEIKRFEPVLAGLKRDRDRRTAQRQKREQQMTAMAAKRKLLEKDLQVVEDKIPKLVKQQEQVRTAREAEAMEHEVSTLQASGSALEGEILELFEKEEKLAAEHAKGLAHEQTLDAEAAAEEKRLLTLRNEREEMVKALKGDRNAAANNLGELREDYDWTFRKHGPTVVAVLDNGGCSGCGGMLVPHLALNVTQEKELTRCPSCHRFLRKPGD